MLFFQAALKKCHFLSKMCLVIFLLVKIEKCVLRISKYMKRKKEIPVSENLSLTSSAALM